MNIFYLSSNPVIAANYHCDKHVVKMILESAQMLSTAWRCQKEAEQDFFSQKLDELGVYKIAHKNHPSCIWARESGPNYKWLYSLYCNLCIEYRVRYEKTHASEKLLGFLANIPKKIDGVGEFTPPPQCMPDQYKQDDTVGAYRAFYIGEKSGFARWNYSKKPEWMENN
tara:strand:+ start:3065 stop:3571 length:507 start_codon:yes stop_codon:yes gene_type:complete